MWRATDIIVPIGQKQEEKNMNTNIVKMSLRALIVLMGITMLAPGVLAAGDYDGWGKYMGSGIALGLAGLGAGISQGSIGSAAVGMLAEDGSKFGPALILSLIHI